MAAGKAKKTQSTSVKVAPTVQTSPSVPTTPQINVLYFIECTDDGIGKTHVSTIKKQLENVSGDLLYLVLYTYGGDVYSAVKIMRILQSKFKEIKILIPGPAYSSGTIMTLGGDVAYMAVDATLGPLDKPTEHPNDGSQISSLDVTQTLTNLASICTSTAAEIYTEIRAGNSDMKISKNEATKLAFETAAKIITPIIDKIDPFNLQRGFREAKIGLYYAIDMLASRMMSKDITQAFKTSHKLVNDFPSHGYGIFRDEARNSLKLNIKNLETLPEWSKIESLFNPLQDKYSKYIKYDVI